MYCDRGAVVLTLFSVLLCSLFCVIDGKNVDDLLRSKRTTEGLLNSNVNNNCGRVKPFFDSRNISILPFDSPKGSICGGQCCGDKTENQLRKQAQRNFASLIQHSSRTLQGILSSTSASLQNHVSELAHQSENKTLQLFSQVYQGMSVLSREPIRALYSDIRAYIKINTTKTSSQITSNTITESSASSFQEPANHIDIKTSVTRFFTDFFPLVYHHILDAAKIDFTVEYKSCLKAHIHDIQPFGEIPKLTAQSLSKSLEATALLLKSLQIGSTVLNTTDRSFTDDNNKHNTECHDALLKMTYCPKCLGLTESVKPCLGYCTNVLRGCLTRYVVELEASWNGYVEAIERLVNAIRSTGNDHGVNINSVLKGLDTKISEAIMAAWEYGKEIDVKVKQRCGVAKFTQKEDPRILEETSTSPSVISGGVKPRQANPRVFSNLPEAQLSQFLSSLVKSRGFYGNLADTLCQDETSADSKDRHCWNGERVAEYTKLVANLGVDHQKYNPEVKSNSGLQSVDPHVADLADKLRQVSQSVTSTLGASVDTEDYMQRDGVDGSGSGDRQYDEDDDSMTGSGSGQPDPEVIDPTPTTHGNPYSSNPRNNLPVGGASVAPKPPLYILVVLCGLVWFLPPVGRRNSAE